MPHGLTRWLQQCCHEAQGELGALGARAFPSAEKLATPLKLPGVDEGLASIATEQHAGGKEEQLPAPSDLGRPCSSQRLAEAGAEGSAKSASHLVRCGLKREHALANLIMQADVVKLPKAAAKASFGSDEASLSLGGLRPSIDLGGLRPCVFRGRAVFCRLRLPTGAASPATPASTAGLPMGACGALGRKC